jgi:glutathione S-transferase
MSDLRIFSYLPNPRLWKASIAARLCGVALDIRGAKPGELQDWLWDFDARPLTDADRAPDNPAARAAKTGFKGTLYKTDAFLDAHPFGTVPAAFSPDGATGIFESNSIMRAVARIGGHDASGLYGSTPYEAARIDSYLDASLVFARDSQIYLLSLRNDELTADIHTRASQAFATYITGIERGVAPGREYLVGDGVTLADICFAAELTLFSRGRAQAPLLARHDLTPIFHDSLADTYPRAMAHYESLCAHDAFAPDIAPYREALARDVANANLKVNNN